MSPKSALFITFFFFNDTATTEIYTLSLHDALPIFQTEPSRVSYVQGDTDRAGYDTGPFGSAGMVVAGKAVQYAAELDRKSTRLNSSHANISYAVFCLKKK